MARKRKEDPHGWIGYLWIALIVTGIILHFNYDNMLSVGDSSNFAANYFAAGDFAVGIFAAGTFAIGIFSAGIFSIGIFSIGIFSLGLWGVGIIVYAKYRHHVFDKRK